METMPTRTAFEGDWRWWHIHVCDRLCINWPFTVKCKFSVRAKIAHRTQFVNFLWRDSNDKPSASHSLGCLSFIGMFVNNFMLDRRLRCISQCLFGGSIVTILDGKEHTFLSRCFSLSGLSSELACVLLYWILKKAQRGQNVYTGTCALTHLNLSILRLCHKRHLHVPSTIYAPSGKAWSTNSVCIGWKWSD